MKRRKLRLFALVGFALLLVAVSASAANQYILNFPLVVGTVSLIRFDGSGATGCTTGVYFDFSGETDTAGTLSAPWPTGTLTETSSSWSNATSTTAIGALGTVTLSVTSSGDVGSFNASDVLVYTPKLTFEATSGTVDCVARNVVRASVKGTLTLTGSSYVGTVGLDSSFTTVPDFGVTATCPTAAATALNCAMGKIGEVVLQASYAE